MSSAVKKRKVSMEPVLQDYTITSFSDLHTDVAGPSDSSLFEDIKNYNVEVPEITFNKTTDINISSGPYPSDSSLDPFLKPESINKSKPKSHRPFYKRSKKKLPEENLFDSCFSDSLSEHSLEKIHKPLQRKSKNKAKVGFFDSDLELSSSIKESPFKKPFVRKSKVKRQSNIFDSPFKDPQPNSPDRKSCRLLQRKSRKEGGSNVFDDILSNESINEPSPVNNFITRRKHRSGKPNDSNLFEDVFCSSQSDVSTCLQPLPLNRMTASKSTKNDTGMFDDLLNTSSNESQDEKSSVLDHNSKSSCLNEDISLMFEYNNETDCHPEVTDFSKSEKSLEPDSKEDNRAINEPSASDQLTESNCLDGENSKSFDVVHNITETGSSVQRCTLLKNGVVEVTKITVDGENEENTKNVDKEISGDYLPDKTNFEGHEVERRNEDKIESMGKLSNESQYSDEVEIEEEDTIVPGSEGEDAEANQSESEETIGCVDNVSESKIDQRNLHDDSLKSRTTLPQIMETTLNENDRKLSVPNLKDGLICTPDSVSVLNVKNAIIYTPDESFKGLMPSSTPNLKGKRVSFLFTEEIGTKNDLSRISVNNRSVSRRKPSIPSSKQIHNSSLVKNFMKENKIDSRKRVSFRLDNPKNDSLKSSNVDSAGKNEQSREIQSVNHSSGASLESLVYQDPSRSGTLDSESVYIDIHPSRGKSTSTSETESYNSKQKSTEENSTQAESECSKNVVKCDSGESTRPMQKDNLSSNYSSEDNNSQENYEGEETQSNNVQENYEGEETQSNNVQENYKGEETQSNNVGDCSYGQSERSYRSLCETVENESVSSDEEQEESDGVEIESDKESEDFVDQKSNETSEDIVTNNLGTFQEQDENQCMKSGGEFKLPFKKKDIKSKFIENSLKVPSKSQLQDILNKIPISEFKKKVRRISSDHCISKEQMQQFEIEEQLMRNQNKKIQNTKKVFASNKLKRPKKWVSPVLYEFLINKLKPHFGIRSHMRAEELVLFLVEHVELIKKNKELVLEDVEEIKLELARLGIINTNWDFFKFVNRFFDYPSKEKIFPSGKNLNVFGPDNVMENIIK